MLLLGFDYSLHSAVGDMWYRYSNAVKHHLEYIVTVYVCMYV